MQCLRSRPAATWPSRRPKRGNARLTVIADGAASLPTSPRASTRRASDRHDARRSYRLAGTETDPGTVNVVAANKVTPDDPSIHAA
jgi:hypothetical protein